MLGSTLIDTTPEVAQEEGKLQKLTDDARGQQGRIEQLRAELAEATRAVEVLELADVLDGAGTGLAEAKKTRASLARALETAEARAAILTRAEAEERRRVAQQRDAAAAEVRQHLEELMQGVFQEAAPLYQDLVDLESRRQQIERDAKRAGVQSPLLGLPLPLPNLYAPNTGGGGPAYRLDGRSLGLWRQFLAGQGVEV